MHWIRTVGFVIGVLALPTICDGSENSSLSDSECLPGFWGANCNQFCGLCVSKICNQDDGVCPLGCRAGFIGDDCIEMCPSHTYGVGCTETCGSCYGNETCSPANGDCPKYCEAGWMGDDCGAECPEGLYGFGCVEYCGFCLKGTCDRITGGCSIDGCLPNHEGVRCDKCSAGYYGLGCIQECGFCLGGSSCDSTTGECLFGCDKGYEGLMCVDVIDNTPKFVLIGCLAGLTSIIIVILFVFLCRLQSSVKGPVTDEEDLDYDGKDEFEEEIDVVDGDERIGDEGKDGEEYKGEKMGEINHVFTTNIQ